MRLDPLEFNDLLQALGQDILWRRAFACPCTNPHSGAADPKCPLCLGKGRSWGAPVDGYAGMTGMSAKRAWAQFGVAELGDVVVTLPSDSPVYDIGQFDRVTMVNSSEPFSKTFTRGAGDVLRFSPTTIDRVYWIVSNAEVEGEIPDVDENGAMTWASGGPATGAVYNVTGRFRPEYFVFADLSQDRAHQHGDALPRRVVLRKFDLYGR